MRKRTVRSSREDGAEASTTAVLHTVRYLAKEVHTLDAELDDLRSENEALRVERQDVLAALTAISRRLGRRTRPARPAAPAMARPSDRSGRELASTVLRRLPSQTSADARLSRDVEKVAGFHLDRAACSVSFNGQEVRLAPREFELLAYMLDHRGQALTREALLRAVFPTASGEDSRTLRVHVQAIRAKLERLGPLPIQITTLHRIGYQLDHVDDAGGHE